MGVEGLGAVAVVKAVVRTMAQSSVLLLVTCSCVCEGCVCVLDVHGPHYGLQ